MKKSKRIFGIIAVVVVLICLLICVISPSSPPVETPTQTEGTEPTGDAYGGTTPYLSEPVSSIPQTEPYGDDMGVAGVPQTYKLADNVRITQVEKDPNEVIHAFEPISPSDPEYLASSDENYNTMEGKVFRNDKTISIDLFDEFNGRDITITFGYITGELNRFLYLNPTYEHSSEYSTQYGFYFNTMLSGGGNVVTLPQTYASEEALSDAKEESKYFHVGRSLDQNEIATYQDPTHPGTVWFTQTPLERDIWIDVLVYQMGGDMLATLRLTISKGLDGTYSIVNLENKNLLQTYSEPDSLFTKEELGYIYEHAKVVIEDPETIGMIQTPGFEMSIERCFIEYRDQSTGLYYTYFVPYDNSVGWYAKGIDYITSPVIAVTVRQTGGFATAAVLYFRIDKMPSNGNHGLYTYIGRDFFLYHSRNTLITQGYPDI